MLREIFFPGAEAPASPSSRRESRAADRAATSAEN